MVKRVDDYENCFFKASLAVPLEDDEKQQTIQRKRALGNVYENLDWT